MVDDVQALQYQAISIHNWLNIVTVRDQWKNLLSKSDMKLKFWRIKLILKKTKDPIVQRLVLENEQYASRFIIAGDTLNSTRYSGANEITWMRCSSVKKMLQLLWHQRISLTPQHLKYEEKHQYNPKHFRGSNPPKANSVTLQQKFQHFLSYFREANTI